MWHEARKQERRIRGMIVDYRKRAERRQDFYEKIQADPTQFIQVHGRRCKIHLDPAVAAAGDGAAIIVPWQGHQDNLIDRFDVRAHLDCISPATKSCDSVEVIEPTFEERQCNYERYRILAQNDFLNVSEEKFLHQLYLEEQFGANAQLELERNQNRKKQHKSGAAIGYSYEEVDSSVGPQPFSHLMHVPSQSTLLSAVGKSEKDSDSDSDSDMDMDVAIDISKLDTSQAHELNACGRNYGMISNDFYSYLTKDADEADALRIAREEEQEKMLLSGRKSRRERRAQKERRIACRPFSPPSYAAKDDSVAGKKEKEEESDSRSPSPSDINAGKITYITSFGGEDELQPHSKISINISSKGPQTLGESCVGATAAATTQVTTYAQKVKENLEKLKQLNEVSKRTGRTSACRRSYTRTRSRSNDRRRRRSRWRSRSHSKSYEYSSRRSQRRRRRTRSKSFSRCRHYRSSSSGKSSRRSRSNSSSSHYSRWKKTHSSIRGRTPSPSGRHNRRSRSSSKIQSHTQNRLSAVATTNTAIISRLDNKTTTTNVKTTDVGGVSPPVMISYPLPTITKTTTNPVDITVVAMMAVPPTTVVQPPTPPLKRYYGRKRCNDSSSKSESDSEIEKDPTKTQTGDGNDTDDRMDVDTTSERSNPLPSSSTSGKHTTTAQAKKPSFSIASETKSSGSNRLNLRERLKRKMQNLLNKQYKADKRAETEKCERERQLQQEREDEMRELALKLRRRQRELRHRYGTPNSSKASDSEVSERMKTHTTIRSKSHSSDRSIAVEKSHKPTLRSDQSEDHHHHRERKQRSRSRSESHRNRRSTSRRRRRSASRPRRQSYDRGSRYGGERVASRCDDRGRRSRSKNDRSSYRDRERQRERETTRDRDKERCRAKERNRDKDREKCQRGGGSAAAGRSSATTSVSDSGSSRNRIVISAPPKLKKLVDY